MGCGYDTLHAQSRCREGRQNMQLPFQASLNANCMHKRCQRPAMHLSWSYQGRYVWSGCSNNSHSNRCRLTLHLLRSQCLAELLSFRIAQQPPLAIWKQWLQHEGVALSQGTDMHAWPVGSAAKLKALQHHWDTFRFDEGGHRHLVAPPCIAWGMLPSLQLNPPSLMLRLCRPCPFHQKLRDQRQGECLLPIIYALASCSQSCSERQEARRQETMGW
mmetsp:Transcript_150724/g.383272  ORF Transcript_150724/g.383272 Transcript_150724/m.383272 type:complete len:217 (-) Transcript_150724:69-719(-)